MAENPSTAEKSAPRVTRPPGSFLERAVLPALVLVALAFLFASAVFIYRESQAKGLPLLFENVPISVPGLPAAVSPDQPAGGGKVAHQNGPCTPCHTSKPDQARLYVAINGRDVTDNASVALRAGETFQLAFHMDNMAGSGEKPAGVGVEVIAPRQGWFVGPGTGTAVQGWSATGAGRSYWNPVWNPALAGNGPSVGRWKPIGGQAGAFYMDFSASSWTVPGVSAAARDDGGEGDPDGRSGAMGGEALLSVAPNVQPGRYEVTLAALGRDAYGKPTQLSQRIAVQVDQALAGASARSTKPARFKEEHSRNRPCGSCHSQTVGRLSASHATLTSDVCTQCHTTTISGPPATRALGVPHGTEGRTECLSCHRSDGFVPAPADHGGRPNSICTLCHTPSTDPSKKPSQVPHPLTDRKDCASCHTSEVIPAVPAGHEQRPNEMCAVCHPKASVTTTSAPPDVPHAAGGARADCLTCHSRGLLGSVEKSHAGFAVDDQNCAGCHKPGPQVNVPGRALNTPHGIESRNNCMACHAPAGGMVSAPADHAGRPSAACAGCHTPGTDRTGSAPKTPHPVEGREACLTCHSGTVIPLVPAEHKGRTNDSCATCHPARKG